MRNPLAALVSGALDRAGPSWFTSVMGTGILAIGIAASPLALPGGQSLAFGLWAADAVLLALLMACWLGRTLRDPRSALLSLEHPATAQPWGAPPMAAFTIAVGFLRIAPQHVPLDLCVAAAQALFAAGVAGSIASAFTVPFRLFTQHALELEHVNGSFLLPVVPPIVASVPAALLSPTWPEAWRGSMLALGYALLGVGVLLAGLVIAVFFLRLLLHKVPAGPLVPAMWIVVGPLGQSIAGFIALGNASRAVWPAAGPGLAAGGLVYGVIMWGFALYWLAMAIVLTLRAVRTGLPFTLGWWAFTFPVGVLTAGTDALFVTTHATLYAIVGLALLALLATMWSLVATKTLRTVAAFAADAMRGARTPSDLATGLATP